MGSLEKRVVSSPLGKIWCFISSLCQSQFYMFPSTIYPLLLGGKKKHDMRKLGNSALPVGIEPRPFNFQPNTLSTGPHVPVYLDVIAIFLCLQDAMQ